MDAETKAFILNRVLGIKKPENPNAAPGFFANPNAPLKKNKGLTYTTQNEQGEIITHNDTHFSLKPLMDALQVYINAYNQSPKANDADWEALGTLWAKKVGGAQRQVPAHIAQEYCHPNRSFEQVANDKSLLDASNPDNLKRQLTFYNYETGTTDLWFTPGSHDSQSGLGFSIGILRVASEGGADTVCGAVCVGAAAGDLAAIRAIDEVRTNDLKQSLANLSVPPHALIPPAPGV